MWSQTCHSRWRHVLIKHCLCWTCVFNDNLLHYTSSALFNGVIALPDPSLKFCLHAYIAVLRSGVHSVFFLNGYLRPSRHTFDSNITAKFVTDSWKAFNKSQQCVAVCLQLILFMTYLIKALHWLWIHMGPDISVMYDHFTSSSCAHYQMFD